MKTEQEQIEEMEKVIKEEQILIANNSNEFKQLMQKGVGYCHAKALYNAGCRKVVSGRDGFVDLLNEETKELSIIEKTRKETAKEIFQKVINICRKEEDFQDGTVNTQLEPLYFGIMNGCAFIRGEVKELAEQYGVEVEE